MQQLEDAIFLSAIRRESGVVCFDMARLQQPLQPTPVRFRIVRLLLSRPGAHVADVLIETEIERVCETQNQPSDLIRSLPPNQR